MPRQTPPGIHPTDIDQFACKMCEHWPDSEAMIPKEGKDTPTYRCKTGGQTVQHNDQPCREFQLGRVRVFYCEGTNHCVLPLMCAYRYFNDTQPKCIKCPLGETITEHLIQRGHVIRNHEDVIKDLGRRGRDRNSEGRARGG